MSQDVDVLQTDMLDIKVADVQVMMIPDEAPVSLELEGSQVGRGQVWWAWVCYLALLLLVISSLVVDCCSSNAELWNVLCPNLNSGKGAVRWVLYINCVHIVLHAEYTTSLYMAHIVLKCILWCFKLSTEHVVVMAWVFIKYVNCSQCLVSHF